MITDWRLCHQYDCMCACGMVNNRWDGT